MQSLIPVPTMNKTHLSSLLCGGALALSLALPTLPARAQTINNGAVMGAPTNALGALASTRWEMTSPTYPSLNQKPTLQFEMNRMSASIGLNRIGADARTSGRNLTFSPLFSTKMAGPRAQMNAEFQLSQALQGVRTYQLSPDGQTLTLRGAQTLTFRRVGATMMANPLASTQWQLTDPTYVGAAQTPTLKFTDQNMSATVGLNTLNADYQTDGSQLRLEYFLSTQMAGPPALMQAEDRFKQALASARSFQISPDGQSLTLRGDQTLTFVRAMEMAQAKGKAGLSTHVLDTTRGTPGSGVTVKLYRMNGENGALIRTAVTNADGRVPELLSADEMQTGVYQIVFEVGPYFARSGMQPAGRAVFGRGRGALWHRRRGRALSCADHGDALLLRDLSRKLNLRQDKTGWG